MDFRVLGEVGVVLGDTFRRLRPKERLVLAVLLDRANRPTPTEVLVDRVWNGRPPKSAGSALRVHIDHLRQVIHQGPVSRLVTTPLGYRLLVDAGELDARRFESLVREGTHEIGTSPERAAERLRAALAEWRGTPYEGIDDIETIDAARAGLERRRLEAVIRLAETELTLGRHRSLLPDLQRWSLEYPTNELLVRSSAIALYRCGDQVAALAVCRRFAEHLVDRFGLDTAHELRALEQAILEQAPDLDPPAVTTPVVVAPVGPTDEPPPLFVGRRELLDRLDRMISDPRPGPRIVALVGPPGIGTSSVARAVARRNADSIVVSRQPGATGMIASLERISGMAAAEQTVRAEGELSPAELRAARLAAHLHGRGTRLVVLDDVAALDPDSVACLGALVPRCPSVVWITTSHGIDPVSHPLLHDSSILACTEVVAVGPMEESEAERLLEAIAPGALDSIGGLDLASLTGGVPFLVGAVGRHLAAGGAWDEVPPTVAEHVRRTLARLEPECRDWLTLLAVDEPVADLPVLAAAMGLPVSRTIELAEAALAAGLLADSPDGLMLRHGLLRSSICDVAGPARRTHAHAALAEAVLRDPAPRADAPVRVATHLRAVDPAGLRPTTAEWTAREAAHLLASDSPIAAAERFDLAARLGATAGLPVETTVGWTLERAAALASAGRLIDSQSVARGAAADSRRHGLRERFAAAAVLATGPWLPTGPEREHAEALTVEAIEWLPPGTAGRLQLAEACVRALVNSPSASAQRVLDDLTDELASAAERRDEPVQAVRAGMGLRFTSWRQGWPPSRRLALSAATARTAARAADRSLHLDALRMHVTDSIEAADAGELRDAVDRYVAEADAGASPLHRWWSCHLVAATCDLAGDADGADVRLADAAALEVLIDPELVRGVQVERGFAELYRGRRFDIVEKLLGSDPEAAAPAGDLLAGSGSDFSTLLALARFAALARLGRPVDAARLVPLAARLAPGPYCAAGAALAADALHGVGTDEREDAVAHLIGLLLPATTGMCLMGSAATLGPADHHLAELFELAGDRERCRFHRERAAVVVERFAPAWQHLATP